MSLDKRRCARYEVPDEFLIIACRNTGKLAMVKNISALGLAFEYIPIKNEKQDWTRVDIFTTSQDRFRLSEIPCKLIYDIDVLSENSAFIGSKTRQCGLKYVELKVEQKRKLERLIDTNQSLTHKD